MGKEQEGFQAKVISEDEVIFFGRCNVLFVPSKQGKVAILPYHTPMVMMLTAGSVEVKVDKQKQHIADIKQGLLYVAENEVSVLINV